MNTQFYKCPNCGRIYNDNKTYYCLNCRYPLKREEEVDEVKHPELNEHKIIGTVNNQTPHVECPYCHSTNTKKISAVGRVLSTEILGLGSSKVGKQWHCSKCGSNF